MTPGEAISRGADYLVVGRPIFGRNRRPREASLILRENERRPGNSRCYQNCEKTAIEIPYGDRFCWAFVLLLVGPAFAQAPSASSDSGFQIGERLTYSVAFEKFTNVAYAELQTVSREDRRYWHALRSIRGQNP